MAKKPGSNALSNDEQAEIMRQYRQQKRVCESENGVLRSIVKRAKTGGMNTKAMIAAVNATKIDPDEVADNLRDQIHLMSVLRVPITMEQLFADFDASVTDKTRREDDLWDAEDKGYRAGRHGVKVEECPYDAGTELHVHWMQEWNKGQAAIARELGPDVKMASTSRKRPSSEDQPALAGVAGTEAEVKPQVKAPRKRAPRAYVPGASRKRGNGASVAH